MADQTLSEQATRRDSAEFRAQVSAALDLELLDIARGAGAWTGPAGAAAERYARAILGSGQARSEALDMSVRIAAAGLVPQSVPTDPQIRKAVRSALRFTMSIPQEP